ncbi:peptidoglycan DD-metalloendopeptidase family protein [Consotaella salsifontis]|uniref:peptidoglycan DD-metalloendopeptidase family protein n=1 Tax=Consotaella salsifontis TaxID=1365950 RepID=UPI0013F5A2FA|nr:peptidoglycan DD-metalloendopeptidase family protein [Consotaella salsifontis]
MASYGTQSANGGYSGGQTNQNQGYSAPASGDSAGDTASYGSAPAATGGVQRAELAPPSTSATPPAGNASLTGSLSASAAPAAAPAQTASPSLDRRSSAPGWGGAGTRVAVQQGETVYTLSKRYGVPADAILSANGMRDARQVAPGSSVVIPSYNYAQKAPVSAPDHNPKTRQASAVVSPAPSASGRSGVTVETGDTLTGIARQHGVSVAELKRANGLSGDTVRIGQTLTIPAGGQTQVASLETPASYSAPQPGRGAPEKPLGTMSVSSGGAVRGASMLPTPSAAPKEPRAYQPPMPAKEAAPAQAAASSDSAPAKREPVQASRAEPAPAASTPAPAASSGSVAAKVEATQEASIAPDSTGIGQLRWPVQGRVLKGYGDRVGSRRNDGLNISVPRGTPVKAAENGVVIYAGEGLKEFGKTVLIKHDDGLVTVYGHADELEVSRGQNVKRGQEIAKSGMSGDTDVPILHFEVRKNSAPVDPMKFL